MFNICIYHNAYRRGRFWCRSRFGVGEAARRARGAGSAPRRAPPASGGTGTAAALTLPK